MEYPKINSIYKGSEIAANDMFPPKMGLEIKASVNPTQELAVKPWFSNMAEVSSRYFRSSEKYVKMNPGRSIAIAVAAGMALGSIWSRLTQRK